MPNNDTAPIQSSASMKVAPSRSVTPERCATVAPVLNNGAVLGAGMRRLKLAIPRIKTSRLCLPATNDDALANAVPCTNTFAWVHRSVGSAWYPTWMG
jgi:hypothetical protein